MVFAGNLAKSGVVFAGNLVKSGAVFAGNLAKSGAAFAGNLVKSGTFFDGNLEKYLVGFIEILRIYTIASFVMVVRLCEGGDSVRDVNGGSGHRGGGLEDLHDSIICYGGAPM
ncbi:hypothetical protein LXL04_028743 [Taraxacum kok-saghyz]